MFKATLFLSLSLYLISFLSGLEGFGVLGGVVGLVGVLFVDYPINTVPTTPTPPKLQHPTTPAPAGVEDNGEIEFSVSYNTSKTNFTTHKK